MRRSSNMDQVAGYRLAARVLAVISLSETTSRLSLGCGVLDIPINSDLEPIQKQLAGLGLAAVSSGFRIDSQSTLLSCCTESANCR